jgi:hypothetical protein
VAGLPSYGEWRLNPGEFAVSRGDARRFQVGIGFLQGGLQQSHSASFLSVIRYRPTVSAFDVTLKVDPLQLLFSYTGDLESATPDIRSLSLVFSSRFFAYWFDSSTGRTFGPSYGSTAYITASAGEALAAGESSAIRNAAGDTVRTFNDAAVFADQGIGAASIVAPAVDRRLSFADAPVTDSGEFANLYLVYEMNLSGSLELGNSTARKPFLFAAAGDPIALDAGSIRPTLEISPVPEPSTVALFLVGLAALSHAVRRQRRAA